MPSLGAADTNRAVGPGIARGASCSQSGTEQGGEPGFRPRSSGAVVRVRWLTSCQPWLSGVRQGYSSPHWTLTTSCMETTKKEARTFTIGGKRLTELRAALVCLEADRLHVVPGTVARVRVPDPAPRHVEIAGFRVSLNMAAQLAAAADAVGVTPAQMATTILEARLAPKPKRARQRDARRTVSAWMLRSEGRASGSRP
jgi:hypothetical protein